MRMDPRGLDICVLSPQLMNCVGRIRKCVLDGGHMSLRVGFVISKALTRTSLSVCLSLCLPKADLEVKLSAPAQTPHLFPSCHDDSGLTLGEQVPV